MRAMKWTSLTLMLLLAFGATAQEEFFDDILVLLTDGKTIRYPHALYLMYHFFNRTDVIEMILNTNKNCYIAQKCGFDNFISTKISENVNLLKTFKQIVRVSCSSDACMNFFTLIRTTENIELRKQCFDVLAELLKERCIEVQETPEGCRVLTSLNRWAFDVSHIPFGRVPEGGDLFYKQHFVDSEDAAPWEVTFYIKAEDAEEIAEIPVSEERIRRGEAREKIQSLFNASVSNVKRFLTELRETECRAKQDVILQYAIRQLLDDGCYPQDKTVEEVIGTGALKDGDDREERIIEVSKGKELRTLAIMIADPWEGDRNSPVDYAGEYSEWGADDLKRKYEFLEKMGYKMSPEEKQVIDGTHEAYIKED